MNETPNKRRRWWLSWPVLLGVAILVGLWYAWSVNGDKEKARLKLRYNELAEALEQERYHDAYVMFTPEYRSKESLEEFRRTHHKWELPTLIPGVRCEVQVSIGRKLGVVWIGGWDKWMWEGNAYHWEKIDGEWYYTGIKMPYFN